MNHSPGWLQVYLSLGDVTRVTVERGEGVGELEQVLKQHNIQHRDAVLKVINQSINYSINHDFSRSFRECRNAMMIFSRYLVSAEKMVHLCSICTCSEHTRME